MTRFTYQRKIVHAPVPNLRHTRRGDAVPPLTYHEPLKTLAWRVRLRAQLEPVFAFAAEYARAYAGPALLFVEETVRARMVRLRELERRFGVAFLLPAKATRIPAVYDLALQYLSGFDVSNEGEYRALPPNLEGRKVFATSPVFPVRPGVLRSKGNELCLILDGPDQYGQFCAARVEYDFGVRLATSELLATRDETCRTGIDMSTRFGFGLEDRDLLREMVARHPRRFRALHVHHGSEVNTRDTYLTLARASMDLATEIGLKPDYLDLGGGTHLLSDADLTALLEALRAFVPGETTLVFEPGRAMGRGAGFALGRVEATSRRNGVRYCTLDLSAQCHLRWSQPALVAPLGEKGGESLRLRCFGPTCAESDFLGEFHFVPPADGGPVFARGDLMLFARVSTYSEAWNASFNGIAPARVVVL